MLSFDLPPPDHIATLLARVIGCVTLLSTVLVASVPAAHADETPPPCSSPECAQFDFWLGEWDLTWDGGKGSNTITKILGGCVVQEQFSAPDMPFQGLSVSTYDPKGSRWLQTWVDSQGGYLDLVGSFADGKMTLAREGERDGKPIRQRMIFYNIAADSMDWDWEVSNDAGATWQLQWRIHYERTKSSR